MNYDKECERLMKANAELALLREFVAAVRGARLESVNAVANWERDSIDAYVVLQKNLFAALTRLDEGRKG